MLTELRISNFAIIEEQSINFGKGLNVISGETGSGKSIILNALELILGARPRAHFIRADTEQMEIQAHFDLTKVSEAVLADLPDIAKGDELVIARNMNSAGKGKVYINGRLGTVALLEEITRKLINICGQGQHIKLLEQRFHLTLIDDFAAHHDLITEYQQRYRAFQDISVRREQYLSGLESRDQRLADLQSVISELSPLNLKSGLRQEIESQLKRHENSEKLILGMQSVVSQLSEDDMIVPQLSVVMSKLSEMARIDSSLQSIVNTFNSARLELEDCENQLTQYLQNLDLDQDKLENLRSTLSELARLERKHRADDGGLLEILDRAREDLEMLTQPADNSTIEKEFQACYAALLELGQKLSKSRKKAADKLAKLVEEDLKELNMPDAKLKAEMEECEVGANGIDRFEFLISSNKGEPFKPLRQIASGGELSRIMLVLKKNLRDRSGVNVLVFDEVDSGISGAVARAVGLKLKELSHGSQVICITHLAQVASLADHHLLVDKVVGKRAISVVREIQEQEKVDEIARMLAGYNITAATRESARELLTSKK